MKQSMIDVTYVAQLARLKLTADEMARFQSQLSQILVYVEELGKLNVDGIEPTAHAAPQINIFRSDHEQPSLPVEQALHNAPRKQNDLFIVPKVVE